MSVLWNIWLKFVFAISFLICVACLLLLLLCNTRPCLATHFLTMIALINNILKLTSRLDHSYKILFKVFAFNDRQLIMFGWWYLTFNSFHRSYVCFRYRKISVRKMGVGGGLGGGWRGKVRVDITPAKHQPCCAGKSVHALRNS